MVALYAISGSKPKLQYQNGAGVLFSNYLLVALRNFARNKVFSSINVIGLSVGLCSCLLIVLFINDELSYDRQNEHAESIYRLESRYVADGQERRWAAVQSAMLPYVQEQSPEVVAGVRIQRNLNPVILRYEDQSFTETGLVFADSSIFDVFTLPLIHGDPATALNDPAALVVDETTARKFFGGVDVLGKTLTSVNGASFKITGVMRDLPRQSHFHFTCLGSTQLLPEGWINWSISDYYTYIRLQAPEQVTAIEERIPALVEGLFEGQANRSEYSIRLRPLLDIHLYSHIEKEFRPNGNVAYIYILGVIAAFLLIIACFNYMNLSTARAVRRAREVGIRKVMGARRTQLIQQFLGESLLLALMAALLALLILSLVLPEFNELAGTSFSFADMLQIEQLALLFGIALGTGLLAGSYPAFFLSVFRPAAVLKGSSVRLNNSSRFSLLLRRSLVVGQFVISIVLIIGTAVLLRQLNFMQSKNLGYNKEQVLVLPLSSIESRQKLPLLKERLLQHSAVNAATASFEVPGKRLPYLGGRFEGQSEETSISWRTLAVDADFLPAMGLQLVAGRNFDAAVGSDSSAAFIVNEAFARAVGWEEPLGKSYEYDFRLDSPKSGSVIGVVKDFHYASLHQAVEPLVMHIWPAHYRVLSLRLARGDIQSTLAQLDDIWQDLLPGLPFEHFFLDETYERLYQKERSLGQIFSVFTLLAIGIACLGLFGLSAFAAEQRTREIGIRKILGASTGSLSYLLSREFIILVVVANLLAWPIAWYGADAWLQNFAYRSAIDWYLFPLAAFGALLIALATVSVRAIKIAMANPVKALRHE